MTTKPKTMLTGNDFYEEEFEAMCCELEAGESIILHCWCTGHTRCQMVEGSYIRKLKERYGDRLTEFYPDDDWRTAYRLG